MLQKKNVSEGFVGIRWLSEKYQPFQAKAETDNNLII